MNSPRHIYNENPKERDTTLFWLLLLVAGIIGFQLLGPFFKPHRYSGSMAEWVITITIVILVTGIFIFDRSLVSISFDDSTETIILTTRTFINGDKTHNYNYSEITFVHGKTPGSLRKKATDFIEIHNKKQKLIKFEKTSIGEYPFERILDEFRQLKKLD